MTEKEQLAVVRLLRAIENYRTSQRGKLGQLEEMEMAQKRHEEELDTAIKAIESLV